jgi:hypothetical protein
MTWGTRKSWQDTESAEFGLTAAYGILRCIWMMNVRWPIGWSCLNTRIWQVCQKTETVLSRVEPYFAKSETCPRVAVWNFAEAEMLPLVTILTIAVWLETHNLRYSNAALRYTGDSTIRCNSGRLSPPMTSSSLAVGNSRLAQRLTLEVAIFKPYLKSDILFRN